MPPHKTFRYLLTLVDTFMDQRWIKAFPTAREAADMVAMVPTGHIILRFGRPQTLQSDNRPAFISSITQQTSESLNITWKLHIPYHPHPRDRIHEVSRATVNQLLHPYTCLPTSEGPYNDAPSPAGSNHI
uniref:Integrase catalytic domain-containing protein n=1 Tax=Mustela putorius furo TaxID=9669 RepID=M3XRG7_MUSPF